MSYIIIQCLTSKHTLEILGILFTSSSIKSLQSEVKKYWYYNFFYVKKETNIERVKMKGLVQKMHDHFINLTIQKSNKYKRNEYFANKKITRGKCWNSQMIISVEDKLSWLIHYLVDLLPTQILRSICLPRKRRCSTFRRDLTSNPPSLFLLLLTPLTLGSPPLLYLEDYHWSFLSLVFV